MLSIVIVNFNSWDLLENCLMSIPSAVSGYPCEIIVIDNASAHDRSKEIQQRFPAVNIIRNARNNGYAAANNIGIMHSRGELVLLLNPDTEAEPSAFREMATLIERMPTVGIVGAKIYFPNGNLQLSCGRFPNLLTEIIENFPFRKLLPRHPLTSYYLYRTWDHATTRKVNWVTGACLMIKRETIEQIGLLDENYFMYSEELDWCYRARELGWDTYYYPRAVIIHHEGGSSRDFSEDLRYQNLVYRQYITSSRLFFRKFYGYWSEFFLRVILFVSHSLRLLHIPRKQTPIPNCVDEKKQKLVFRGVLDDLTQNLDVLHGPLNHVDSPSVKPGMNEWDCGLAKQTPAKN